MMKRTEILGKLAPCGLDCSCCASFKGGPIARQSRTLLEALGDYQRMAQKMTAFFEPFAHFDSFQEILRFFADAKCDGCRSGGSRYPDCAAKSCFKEMKVDFCGECKEFPCSRNRYNEDLHKRWLANGEFIRTKGIESFYDMQAGKPRY
ncbi:DUF3795 domain-containing protein [Sediminispirochaeta smaragdinae]|nr:DUF3795 domain-containing protein [Sediminispirochaeta smaragdinae]